MQVNLKPPYPIQLIVDETTKLIKTHLWAKIILFLFLGLAVGFLIGPQANLVPVRYSAIISDWLSLPGKIFLILMQMIIIPLIVSSVVLGVLNAGSLEVLKKMSIRLVPYFIVTTTVATMLGFFFAQMIEPGRSVNIDDVLPLKDVATNISSQSAIDSSITEKITSVLPKNPLGALVAGELFQIVIFSLITGVALLNLTKEKAKPIIDLLMSVQHLSMIVVNWAMKLAPIAVFGLMAELLSKVGSEVLVGIGTYALTVLLTLTSVLIFYLLIVFIGAKRNPFKFLKQIRSVQLLAFSTSSSAAVMPLTLETAESKLGISSSISRFVIPIGTTINMDGTAAYQGVATCFIAQAFGLDLSMGQLLLIVVSATGASIGAPGTPGVGMAVLAAILKSVGLPAEAVILIMGIDRILDMFRTVINVTGDLTAALFFDKLSYNQKG